MKDGARRILKMEERKNNIFSLLIPLGVTISIGLILNLWLKLNFLLGLIIGGIFIAIFWSDIESFYYTKLKGGAQNDRDKSR